MTHVLTIVLITWGFVIFTAIGRPQLRSDDSQFVIFSLL